MIVGVPPCVIPVPENRRAAGSSRSHFCLGAESFWIRYLERVGNENESRVSPPPQSPTFRPIGDSRRRVDAINRIGFSITGPPLMRCARGFRVRSIFLPFSFSVFSFFPFFFLREQPGIEGGRERGRRVDRRAGFQFFFLFLFFYILRAPLYVVGCALELVSPWFRHFETYPINSLRRQKAITFICRLYSPG